MHACIYVNPLSSKAIQNIKKNNRSKSRPKNIIKHSKYHGHETSGPGSHVSAVKYPLFLQDFSTKHLILQTSHYIASISVALCQPTWTPFTLLDYPLWTHKVHLLNQAAATETATDFVFIARISLGHKLLWWHRFCWQCSQLGPNTQIKNAKTGGQILSTGGGEGMWQHLEYGKEGWIGPFLRQQVSHLQRMLL